VKHARTAYVGLRRGTLLDILAVSEWLGRVFINEQC